MKKIFIIFIFTPLLFSQSKVGTSAAPFLGIPIGARANSLGASFVAKSDDATSMYWNPSGIAWLENSEAIASHTNWLVQSNLDWVGVVLKISETDAIGISATELNYGEELVTTELDQDGYGEKWSASDISLSFSYAKKLTDRFSIGGNAKYIQQKIWNESASTFALDVGLLFLSNFNNLKIGMSISNFGSDMRLDGKDLLRKIDLDPENNGNNETIVSRLKTDDWPLPLFFRIGVAFDIFKSENFNSQISIDALRPSDNSETLNIGLETDYKKSIYFRTGYKSLFTEEKQDGFTFGFGYNYDLNAVTNVSIDYALQKYGIFGDLQTISIGFIF